ncbi:2377_t:CDS:2, partial [Dentiscutata heterogama]
QTLWKMSQSTSDKHKEIPSIALSDLSKYFHFSCDKLISNILNYKRNTDHSALKKALISRLKEIKQNIFNELKDNIIDHSDTEPSEIRKILENVQVGQFLYRLKFEVSDDLYDELKIREIVRLKAFIPDFVEVIEEDGEKRLIIWDANASKEARFSYQFKVASYAFLLDNIIKSKRMRGVSISRSGGIFLYSSEELKRQTFRIDFLFPKVERFLQTDLPRIASASEVSWPYNVRCKNCEFVNDCRKEAEGAISMIPYLSIENSSYLKRVIQNEKSKSKLLKENVVDIEDLSNHISKLN